MLEIDSEQDEQRRQIGEIVLPVRFFIHGLVDGELDLIECTEQEFLDSEGNVIYDRDSRHENGVAQIRLTKLN